MPLQLHHSRPTLHQCWRPYRVGAFQWPCLPSGRRNPACSVFRVEPYELKQDEALEDVAKRKGIERQQLLALNHEMKPEDITQGRTILVPQGQLSAQDRAVLDSMKSRRYRTYVVKRNETIEDVIGSRGIELEEVEDLNPDTDLDRLADHEIIKLPAHKYSPQEQHEIYGTFGAPRFLSPGGWLANSLIAGVLAVALYSYWLYQQSKRHKESVALQKKIEASRKKFEVPSDLPLPSYMASMDEPNKSELLGEAGPAKEEN